MRPDTAGDARKTIGDRIIAIRDKWHTKQHPLFTTLAAGKLDIKTLAIHQACHAKFVVLALESFGLLYARGPMEVKKMCIENLAEEEGLIMTDKIGDDPHEHMDMLHNFCLAAGMTRKEIDATELTPAWWARTLFYRYMAEFEAIGVALAAMFTQEGQQPQLNAEITIPALTIHYGFDRDSPAIEFFVAHEAADQEHSQRQIELASKYLDTPELEARAAIRAEEICRLRWASASDIYRLHHLGDAEILPPGCG